MVNQGYLWQAVLLRYTVLLWVWECWLSCNLKESEKDASYPVHYTPYKDTSGLFSAFCCAKNLLKMRYSAVQVLKLHQSSASPTLSHGLHGDDFTGVSTACSSDGHHPDTVLTVPAQVRDAVEKHIWGSFKFAAYLGERQHCKITTTDLIFQLLFDLVFFRERTNPLESPKLTELIGELMVSVSQGIAECRYDWVEQYVITAAEVLMPGQLHQREQRADLGLLE